jgi:hypothetical protein
VGKSRLAQEFCDTANVPYLFYTATKGESPVEAIAAFFAELAEQDEIFDGALQTAWDRLLSQRPVLLLLLGSDLHTMERLTAYDRPFFGRADNLLLGPLNPADVGDALGLDAADAIDSFLLSGDCPASSAPGRGRFRRLNSPSASARTRRLRCSGSPRRRCWLSSLPRTPHAGCSRRLGTVIARTPTSPPRLAAGTVPSPRELSPPYCTGWSRRNTSSRSTSRCQPGQASPRSIGSPIATCGSTWRSAAPHTI